MKRRIAALALVLGVVLGTAACEGYRFPTDPRCVPTNRTNPYCG